MSKAQIISHFLGLGPSMPTPIGTDLFYKKTPQYYFKWGDEQ